jgi:hypothetical protein
MLLAAVDSLELLSMPNSRVASIRISLNDETDNLKRENNESQSDYNIPTYLKPPKQPSCQLYAKMTDDEWKQLKKLEHQQDEKSQREPSVCFNETIQIGSFSRASQGAPRRSSSLKRISKEIDASQNALHPIQQKCREALRGMKIEEIFLMLCDDDPTKK